MKRDFNVTSNEFFKIMMQQTQKLLYLNKKALLNHEQCSVLQIKRSRTDKLKA